MYRIACLSGLVKQYYRRNAKDKYIFIDNIPLVEYNTLRQTE